LLVGGFNHLEKYKFVNGKDDIPYMKWNIKIMFETTNQVVYVFKDVTSKRDLWIFMVCVSSKHPIHLQLKKCVIFSIPFVGKYHYIPGKKWL